MCLLSNSFYDRLLDKLKGCKQFTWLSQNHCCSNNGNIKQIITIEKLLKCHHDISYEIRQEDHIRILAISKASNNKMVISKNLENNQQIESIALATEQQTCTMF